MRRPPLLLQNSLQFLIPGAFKSQLGFEVVRFCLNIVEFAILGDLFILEGG